MEIQQGTTEGSGDAITELIGDVSAIGPGIAVATLATVNSDVGSFTYASITVNAKGLVTAAANGTAPEVPLTFSTGLTRTANTVTANISTGIAGGQTIYGGIAANDDLTIHGTSNATRTTSYVFIQPTAGAVLIGTTTANGATLLVNGTISSPGAGASSERFGLSSLAGGVQSVAFGNGASSSADNSVAIGSNALSSGQYGIALGYNAGATGTRSTAIGLSAVASHDYTFAMGYSASATGETGIAIGGFAQAAYRAFGFGYGANASGDYSFAMGYSAGASAVGGIAIGGFASAPSGSVALGYSAVIGAGLTSPIAIGNSASAQGDACTVIGGSAYVAAGHTGSIVIGYASASTTSHQFVAGSDYGYIDNVFFGKGVTNSSPVSVTINGTGGSGTNIAGGDVYIAGGKGTGNAANGNVYIQVSTAGASGTTLQSLATVATFTRNGLKKRVYSVASNTSLTPEKDTYDLFCITALAGNITINNSSTTTWNDGDQIEIRLLDNGTARTITFGSMYVAKAGTALPTTTVLGKNLAMMFEYNSNLAKLNLMAGGQET